MNLDLQKSALALRRYLGLGLLLCAWLVAAHAQVVFQSVSQSYGIDAGSGISHVGAGNVASRDTCGTVTPSIPAGSNGDVLIALVNSRENGATLTQGGATWNRVYYDNTGDNIQVAIYWRVATGSDSFTITQSNSCDSLAAQVSRFSGVDTSGATPFDSAAPYYGAVRQSSGSLDTGTVVTNSANAMLLVAGFVRNNRTVTEGSGWSPSFDTALNVASDLALSLHYELQTAAGSKSVSNWDLSGGGSDINYGIMLALKPVAGSGRNITIPMPSGVTSGDVLVAALSVRYYAATVTPPSGWTLIQDTGQSNGAASCLSGTTAGIRTLTYYKVAGASESAAVFGYSSNCNDSGFGSGGILRFSGVDTSSPVVTSAATTTPSSTTHTAPSVTPGVADTMLVTVHSYGSSRSWSTAPTGMTERVNQRSYNADDAKGTTLGVYTQSLTGTGATGTRSATGAGDADYGATQSIVLRPGTTMNCFTDSFTGADGSSPSSDWTTTSSSGSFGLPKIYSNRLRLTDASGNVATAAHLQKLFPGAGNKIVVQFDYFAYNGTGADGIAVTLSDASVTPQAGAYGGSLGYAQKTGIDGFAGGWLGVGVDEYGNFANPTEGRSGGPGQIPDSVTVRGSGSGQTGYAYHATSNGLTPGVDQPGSTAGPGHRYRVTVDHTDGTHAYVQVERDTTGTGSSYSTLIPQYDAKAKSGQAAVPTNWLLSFTGSTGGSTNIHEIDNLSVCTTQPIIAAGLNHIRIEHTGSGVTCAPTTLTIKACADAACSSLYSGGVTGTLTATGTPTVNWVGGAGFTIDSTGSVTKQAQVVTAGTVTWSTTSVSPAPTSTTDCYVGAAASCAFTSALAGFLFDVPNHAADTSQTITVSAVKQADNSLACTPAFASVSKSVSFACGYSNPASGTLPVTVGGTAINCGTSAGVTLGFNATGVASTTVRYADVGQMTLTASYAGTSGSETGLAMTGSDSFIAAPASFTVAPGGPYVAGNPFSVTVTAKNASGGTTPNFGKESTTENVTLGHALVGPAGGNDPAQGGTTTLADASFQSGGGAASASDLTWAEVGDISLTATLASGSYLGSGLTATGAGAAGPFKPAYFETVVTPGAGTFTYSGQTFSVKATAKSAGGGTTKNYAGAYAKAVTLTDGNAATNSSGTLGSFANAAIPAASFIAYSTDPVNAGTATVSNIVYTFTNKETAPLEAPGSAPLAMRATDTDSVTSSGHTEGTTPIRSGRLNLTNAYGAEQLSLSIPAEVQYYNGTFWATNTQDGSSTAGWTVSPSGTTALVGSGSTSLTLGASLTSGLASLAASAPGTGGSGYLDLAVAVPGYLNFPWGGCANMTAFPANCLPAEFVGPGARATFGIHRGDRRIIYRR